jgi:putative membrane protein
MKHVAHLALALAFVACDSSKDDRPASYPQTPMNEPAEETPAPVPTQQTSTDTAPRLNAESDLGEDADAPPAKETLKDADFVSKAAVGGKFEVDSSKAALTQKISGAMKAFATRMVADHGKANKELEALAKKKGWTLPTSLDAKHQGLFEEIQKAPTADLATTYERIHRDAHVEAMKLFEQCSTECQDAELKTWATNTLKVIQAHHAELEKLAKP